MDSNKFTSNPLSPLGPRLSLSSRTGNNSQNSVRVPERRGTHSPFQGAARFLNQPPRNSRRSSFSRGNRENNVSSGNKMNQFKSYTRGNSHASSSLPINLNQCEINGSKYYICPGCKMPYNYYKNTSFLCGRVPRVLPCKHTVCEECIKKWIKNALQIQCPTCHEHIPVNMRKLYFDYNYYIVGHLTCSRISQIPLQDLSNLNLTLTNARPEEVIPSGCEEKCDYGGCFKIGSISCIECSGVYCIECDEKLHSGEERKTHHRDKKESLELKKCPDHLMWEEIFCERCKKCCCCYCMLENHEGHPRMYLVRLSPQEEEELQNAYTMARANLELLKKSQKMTCRDGDKVLQIEIDISQCFSNIYAHLNLVERKMREEARLVINNGAKLARLNRVLLGGIDTIKYLIHCVEERSSLKLNLAGLLRKLRAVNTIPACLAATQPFNNIKLVVDDHIKYLEDCFRIESRQIENNTVLQSDIPPVSSDDDDSTQLRPSNDTTLQLRSSERPTESNQGTFGIPSLRGPRINFKYRNYIDHQDVYVTHIQSIDSFYIQFKRDDGRFKTFERDIQKYVDRTELGIDNVVLNQIYMAPLIENTNKWGRVRVLEEIVNEGQTSYKLQFVDYGNCITLQKTEMKCISNNLVKKPTYAIQCKLNNANDIIWPKDTHLKLAKLLTKCNAVTIQVKDVADSVHEVDMYLKSSVGDIHSVKNLLISELSYSMDDDESASESFQATKRIFDNSDRFEVGQSYNVFIRYVHDPFNIYVQKVSHQYSMETLMNSMELYYKETQCDVHIPVMNTDVIISYPSSNFGNWHRAKIQEVFTNKQMVKAFLVDWGKLVNVPWSKIRSLKEMFKRNECLVVKVKLADINPKTENGWSHFEAAGARSFLEKYAIKDKQMKMLVSKANPLEIALFEHHDTYDENINTLLVENDLASSTGNLSHTLSWMNTTTDVETTNENEFLPIYKDDTEEEEEPASSIVRSQVVVKRFVDPHSMFISFVAMKSESDRLNEELNIHYQQQSFTQEQSWNVGEKLVVYDSEKNSYKRGRVISVHAQLYCVYLLDEGEDMYVPLRDLRLITPYFLCFPNMVLRCHLANIKPAGDNRNWSLLSIEWFQKIFDNYKDIYVMKLFDDQSKISIPVAMWYSKILHRSALEPSRRKFVSIDIKAVQVGLAFLVDSKLRQSIPVLETDPRQSTLTEDTDTTALEREGSTISLNSSEQLNAEVSTIEAELQPEERATECIVREWQPAMRIKKSTFNAYVTLAETDGYLFIRDEELEIFYQEMKTRMKIHFDDIPKPAPFVLHQYQMVTIFFEDYWYRGLVLNVIDKETAKVMMIDYGSDHIMKIKDLHNEIMYPDIPIMVTKIKLFDLHCKTSKWLTADVDDFLQYVPEYAKIVIRSSLLHQIPLAEVYDSNGVSLNDKLAHFSPNLYRIKTVHIDECAQAMPIASNDEACSNVQDKRTTWFSMMEYEENLLDYNYTKLPKFQPGQKVEMEIIAAYDYRTVSIFVESEASEDEFNALSASMQEEANQLERLNNLRIGMPCMTIFQNDGKWYRAKIFHIDVADNNKFVTVFYVDYGNFEVVNVSNVRRIKFEWLNFPAKFHVARIDFKLMDEQQRSILFRHMQQLNNTKKFVELIKERPLRIHIYDGDVLYYNTFVQKNIVMI